MKGKGMKCVGWYHSHPTFAAIPSRIDLENQSSYQKLVGGPFVGGIVSPYNPERAQLKSELNWFAVEEGVGMSMDAETVARGIQVPQIFAKVKMLCEWYSSNR